MATPNITTPSSYSSTSCSPSSAPTIIIPELSEEPILVSPSLSPPETSLPTSLSPYLLSHSAMPQSTPASPQLAHRPQSGGKLSKGIKRIFRPPHSQTSFDRITPGTNDEQYQSDHPAPKTKRHVRIGSARIRRFRKVKRRNEKGQYHSDDGYTSDPGPPLHDDPLPSADMDEDDETDGADGIDGADSSEGHSQGAESRSERKSKLDRKFVKPRRRVDLPDTLDYGALPAASQQLLQALDTPGNDKALQKIRGGRVPVKPQISIDQNRKKTEKEQPLLQEAGAKERLRGKIEGRFKAPLIGIWKGFNYAGNRLKKGGRIIIRARGSNSGDLGDGDLEEDEGKYDMVIEPDEEGEEEEEAPSLMDLVTVPKTTLDELQEQNETLKKDIADKESRVSTLEEIIGELVKKLDQVRDTYERLQDQVNDVMDLHQNAIGEVRGQLEQVENMTVTKTQDLEDMVEEYQGKVEKLDTMIHNEIERKAEVEKARNYMMKAAMKFVSLALQTVAFILNLISIIKRSPGAVMTGLMVLLAILFYFLISYWTHSSN